MSILKFDIKDIVILDKLLKVLRVNNIITYNDYVNIKIGDNWFEKDPSISVTKDFKEDNPPLFGEPKDPEDQIYEDYNRLIRIFNNNDLGKMKKTIHLFGNSEYVLEASDNANSIESFYEIYEKNLSELNSSELMKESLRSTIETNKQTIIIGENNNKIASNANKIASDANKIAGKANKKAVWANWIAGFSALFTIIFGIVALSNDNNKIEKLENKIDILQKQTDSLKTKINFKMKKVEIKTEKDTINKQKR